MYVQWYMLNRGYKIGLKILYFDFAYEGYYDTLTIGIEDIFVAWHNVDISFQSTPRKIVFTRKVVLADLMRK